MQAFERIEFPQNGEIHLRDISVENGKSVRIIIVPIDDPVEKQNTGGEPLESYITNPDEDVNWEEVFGV